jgi:hypothetical protein
MGHWSDNLPTRETGMGGVAPTTAPAGDTVCQDCLTRFAPGSVNDRRCPACQEAYLVAMATSGAHDPTEVRQNRGLEKYYSREVKGDNPFGPGKGY